MQCHHIEISFAAIDMDMDLYYTGMTSLGVEFLDKCDNELHHQLGLPPDAQSDDRKFPLRP
jgi:hypothetical protein